MSTEHKRFLKKLRTRKIVVTVCRVGLLAAFLGLWELVAAFNVIDPFIISSPSRIVRLIGELYKQNNLFPHIVASLYETVMGFVIATAVGTVIAIILWLSKGLRDVLEPYIITLNSLPKIALGPIIIVWMGTGSKAIIFMAVLICVIITIISMLAGFIGVDAEKIMLLKSMKASKMKILTKLVLPANVPTLISVLKINACTQSTLKPNRFRTFIYYSYTSCYGIIFIKNIIHKLNSDIFQTVFQCDYQGHCFGIILCICSR